MMIELRQDHLAESGHPHLSSHPPFVVIGPDSVHCSWQYPIIFVLCSTEALVLSDREKIVLMLHADSNARSAC